jgi:hypothetical protein
MRWNSEWVQPTNAMDLEIGVPQRVISDINERNSVQSLRIVAPKESNLRKVDQTGRFSYLGCETCPKDLRLKCMLLIFSHI